MIKIHPGAEVSPEAQIGDGTLIWRNVQIREGSRIGKKCILGQGAYIDFGVIIGDNVKIQNNASLYHGLEVEDGVFIGPHVVFTNDKYPARDQPRRLAQERRRLDGRQAPRLLRDGDRCLERDRDRRNDRALGHGWLGRGRHKGRARPRAGGWVAQPAFSAT